MAQADGRTDVAEESRRQPGAASEGHGVGPAGAPIVTLASGAAIPAIGLGTWPMDDEQAEVAVAEALRAGWRLIDTAENYRNEAGVGRGIASSGVPREQIFVTTKFNREWHSEQGPRQALEASLGRLGLDHVDLLLIHWPNPAQDRYVEAWKGLIALQRDGRVRAIGTSNFLPDHLRRIVDATGVAPHVNQVQMSPFWVRDDLLQLHRSLGIATEAWSPIGRGAALLDMPVVQKVAQAHARTPAQVVLRWHVQRGVIPIPKTINQARLRENLAVFDFELTEPQMLSLASLDGKGKELLDPMTFGH